MLGAKSILTGIIRKFGKKRTSQKHMKLTQQSFILLTWLTHNYFLLVQAEVLQGVVKIQTKTELIYITMQTNKISQ